MIKPPENVYKLQNGNDKQPSRPGPTDRPNGQTPPQRPSNSINKWLLVLVGIMLVVYIYSIFSSNFGSNSSTQPQPVAYSDFLAQVNANNVKDVTINGTTSVTGTFIQPVKGQTQFMAYQLPTNDPQLTSTLNNHHVQFNYQQPQDNSIWLNLLVDIVPWLFLIGLFFFFTRRSSQGQQGIFSFGKSRAKLILEDRPSTTFADVAGVDESKYELQEVVEF